MSFVKFTTDLVTNVEEVGKLILKTLGFKWEVMIGGDLAKCEKSIAPTLLLRYTVD